MVQAEKQKKVFLSLCGQHDYDLLTGKVYISLCLYGL